MRLIFTTLLLATSLHTAEIQGTVVAVSDGDTITVLTPAKKQHESSLPPGRLLHCLAAGVAAYAEKKIINSTAYFPGSVWLLAVLAAFSGRARAIGQQRT